MDSGTTDMYLPVGVADAFSEAWEAATGEVRSLLSLFVLTLTLLSLCVSLSLYSLSAICFSPTTFCCCHLCYLSVLSASSAYCRRRLTTPGFVESEDGGVVMLDPP